MVVDHLAIVDPRAQFRPSEAFIVVCGELYVNVGNDEGDVRARAVFVARSSVRSVHVARDRNAAAGRPGPARRCVGTRGGHVVARGERTGPTSPASCGRNG